ncbi:MAG: DUF362 domain-containing protein [Thermoplasmata archaeon]
MQERLDELEVDISRCMHCGACVGSCPVNAIFLNEVLLEFSDDCNLCRRCIKVCPVGAIKLIGGK